MRFEKNLEAVFTAQLRKRCGSGAEDATGAIRVRFVERPLDLGRRGLRMKEAFAVNQQRSEGHERRVAEALAVAYLLFVKALVVLRASVTERVVFGVKGLYQDPARARAAPGTAGHLRNQLK